MPYNILDDYSKAELDIIPLKHLPLTRHAWTSKRGAKDYREYKRGDQLIAKVYYEYTYSADKREIIDWEEHIEVYGESGELILDKPLDREVTYKKLESVNRDIRWGQIDYLKGFAKHALHLAPYVDILLKWYDKEIAAYKEDGTIAFEKAIEDETNPVILGILSTEADPVNEPGITVSMSILHQLKGILDV